MARKKSKLDLLLEKFLSYFHPLRLYDLHFNNAYCKRKSSDANRSRCNLLQTITCTCGEKVSFFDEPVFVRKLSRTLAKKQGAFSSISNQAIAKNPLSPNNYVEEMLLAFYFSITFDVMSPSKLSKNHVILMRYSRWNSKHMSRLLKQKTR